MTEVLFADDDAAMRQMVAAALESNGYRVRLARSGAEALEQLRQAAPDLLLLDYRMGTPNGFEVCRSVKTDPHLQHLPVLIITGQGSVDYRLQGFDAGADDYLAKPFDVRELLARVRALLRLARQALDRNPTTGLPGGTAIEQEFARRCHGGETVTVCYFDLDYFKPFADRFGFAVADAVIRELRDALLAATAGHDAFVGHIGGDDFIVLCQPEHARDIAEVAQAGFRERLARRLPLEVVLTGSYAGTDREGVARRFPLTRPSAAVVHVPASHCAQLSQLGEVVAEAKHRAKGLAGSGIEEVELTN